MTIASRGVAALVALGIASHTWAAEPKRSEPWCNENLWGAFNENTVILDPFGVDKFAGSPAFNLTLSGGGYRAMLFHVGVLRRLNDSGLLARLKVVSSVSGGSITAGLLAHRWTRLEFDANGKASHDSFERNIEQPLRELASTTHDIPSGVLGLLLPVVTSGDLQVKALDSALFGDAHPLLSSIPAGARQETELGAEALADANRRYPARPTFIFNATNVMTGEIWQFRSAAMGGNRTGWTKPGDTISLAQAIAASAAFPPFLSPVSIKPGERAEWFSCPAELPAQDEASLKLPHGLDDSFEPAKSIATLPKMTELTPGSGVGYVPGEPELIAKRWKEFQETVYLMDGGVRDNLGLHAIDEMILALPFKVASASPQSAASAPAGKPPATPNETATLDAKSTTACKDATATLGCCPGKSSATPPASAASLTEPFCTAQGRPVRKLPFATFVADGGRTYKMDPSPWQNWYSEVQRVLDIVTEEPNLLRVRNIIRGGYNRTAPTADDYSDSANAQAAHAEQISGKAREKGKATDHDAWAYWSIRRLPKHHGEFELPPEKNDWLRGEVNQLSSVDTRMSSLASALQQRLINWGYIATQHGMPYIADLWLVDHVFGRDCDLKAPEPPANAGPLKCLRRIWSGAK